MSNDNLIRAVKEAMLTFTGDTFSDGRINDLIEAFEQNGIELILTAESNDFIDLYNHLSTDGLNSFQPMAQGGARQAMFASRPTTIGDLIKQESARRNETDLESGIEPSVGHKVTDLYGGAGVVCDIAEDENDAVDNNRLINSYPSIPDLSHPVHGEQPDIIVSETKLKKMEELRGEEPRREYSNVWATDLYGGSGAVIAVESTNEEKGDVSE